MFSIKTLASNFLFLNRFYDRSDYSDDFYDIFIALATINFSHSSMDNDLNLSTFFLCFENYNFFAMQRFLFSVLRDFILNIILFACIYFNILLNNLIDSILHNMMNKISTKLNLFYFINIKQESLATKISTIFFRNFIFIKSIDNFN